jgi:Zn-dependent peptidase ImmA (M78 family)
MKYTEEHEAKILERYNTNPEKETVEELAKEFGVSTRSVIGKLSKMGIYKKVSYTPKYAEKPISKEEIVAHLASELGIDPDKLIGLAKSQKPALLSLEEALVYARVIEPRE